MLSSMSFIALAPTFRSLILFELIFVYDMKQVGQINSFIYSYPVVTVPFVDKNLITVLALIEKNKSGSRS